MNSHPNIYVVMPCYRCKDQVLSVLADIPDIVTTVICVDDFCPDKSGHYIEENCNDPRVSVLFNTENLGVGGATITGYQRCLQLGADVVVKIDSDGQMDPGLIPRFIRPLLAGEADYTKGNRFYDLSSLQGMPPIRIFGNAVLSFLTKLSSGYWNVMDPTNGYTAITAPVLRVLPLSNIDNRYFFESDMLFRLSTFRAVVLDIPMHAKYGDEQSHMAISQEAFRFLGKHIGRFGKRIFYNYFLRNFNIASLNLVFGTLLVLTGLLSGYWNHAHFSGINQPTPTGIIMIVVLLLIIGFELLLSFVNFDVSHTPSKAISPSLINGRVIAHPDE